MTSSFTAATAAEASRLLWLRAPGRRYHFEFDASSPFGLSITPFGPTGRVGANAPPAAATTGVLLVDARGELVFCASGGPNGLLAELAAWSRDARTDFPAAASLIGAGVLMADGASLTDEALGAIDTNGPDIQRDFRLWVGLPRADTAALGAVLLAAHAGERHWFAFVSPGDGAAPPLLLSPMATDPNRDRIGKMLAASRDEAANTGIAYPDDDGCWQFAGARLQESDLQTLADFVHRDVAAAPGLAQLAHCRLARVGVGKVAAVFADATIWAGLDRAPAAGSDPETRILLKAAKPGDRYWFWLTNSRPFLALAAMDTDPGGTTFAAMVTQLGRRFPTELADALAGTVGIEPGGGFVFTATTSGTANWRESRQRLAEHYAPEGAVLAQAVLRLAVLSTAQRQAAGG